MSEEKKEKVFSNERNYECYAREIPRPGFQTPCSLIGWIYAVTSDLLQRRRRNIEIRTADESTRRMCVCLCTYCLSAIYSRL